MTIQDFNTVIVQGAFSPDMSINLRRLTKGYLLTRQDNMVSYPDVGDDWAVEFRSKLQPAKGLLYLHIQREDVNYIIENSILLRASVASVMPDMTLSMLCIYEAVCCSRECLCFAFIVRTQSQRRLKNPSTGGGDTGLTQDNQFDVLGTEGVLCGDEFCCYEDFPLDTNADEPSNQGSLLWNAVLGAIVTVAVTTAAVAIGLATFGIGTAVMAGLGAAIAGGAVTYNIYQQDKASGNVRSALEAGLESGLGAVIGALTGGFVGAGYATAGSVMTLQQAGFLTFAQGAGMRTAMTVGDKNITATERLGKIYNPISIGFDISLGIFFQGISNKTFIHRTNPSPQEVKNYNTFNPPPPRPQNDPQKPAKSQEPTGPQKAAVDPKAGKYTHTIKWGNRTIKARPEGKGFFGTRVNQSNPRVDSFELKVNPNNESYYLPLKDGTYVQFENMVNSTVQDGKLIIKQNSFYHVDNLPAFARQKVLEEAKRQIEAASLAGYKVEWLVSEQNAVEQLTKLFSKENIDIRIFYFPE